MIYTNSERSKNDINKKLLVSLIKVLKDKQIIHEDELVAVVTDSTQLNHMLTLLGSATERHKDEHEHAI